ncbi:uncharacterized protein LOC118410374 [Branchiostoma floridae]|uniref:Uncharacterized protein LOC118410374 n=1 Tax=Branchiostoma floridae TaxID=7739 RepID=C3Z6A7_BRAFL|nr:uncharacterized protein LOC118410374 [Branchiostoma floridae]|eukprot:XP_002595930.1 hypothetical protein BRAFLDRAFT_128653 [Branchiostoma floridae]
MDFRVFAEIIVGVLLTMGPLESDMRPVRNRKRQAALVEKIKRESGGDMALARDMIENLCRHQRRSHHCRMSAFKLYALVVQSARRDQPTALPPAAPSSPLLNDGVHTDPEYRATALKTKKRATKRKVVMKRKTGTCGDFNVGEEEVVKRFKQPAKIRV